MPITFESFVPVSNNKTVLPEDLHNLPAVCKAPYSQLVVEEKYDGSFYVCRINKEGLTDFTSKRISEKTGKMVNKTGNLPELSKSSKMLSQTILLGEVTMPGGFKEVMSIMGSSPEEARFKIRTGGVHPTYIVFDCMMFAGEDLTRSPYGDRVQATVAAVQLWKNEYAEFSTQVSSAKAEARYAHILERGGEGVMIKSMEAVYGQGVFKCKKSSDVSVYVSGYTEALEGKTGKYKGLIGAVLFSCTHKGVSVEIGQCSGMSDEIRREISANRSKWMGEVMDVRCQPPDNPEKWDPTCERLRHPRFIRFRSDLSAGQCTAQKLRKDFSSFKRSEA